MERIRRMRKWSIKRQPGDTVHIREYIKSMTWIKIWQCPPSLYSTCIFLSQRVHSVHDLTWYCDMCSKDTHKYLAWMCLNSMSYIWSHNKVFSINIPILGQEVLGFPPVAQSICWNKELSLTFNFEQYFQLHDKSFPKEQHVITNTSPQKAVEVLANV